MSTEKCLTCYDPRRPTEYRPARSTCEVCHLPICKSCRRSHTCVPRLQKKVAEMESYAGRADESDKKSWQNTMELTDEKRKLLEQKHALELELVKLRADAGMYTEIEEKLREAQQKADRLEQAAIEQQASGSVVIDQRRKLGLEVLQLRAQLKESKEQEQELQEQLEATTREAEITKQRIIDRYEQELNKSSPLVEAKRRLSVKKTKVKLVKSKGAV